MNREIKFRGWDGDKFGFITLHPGSVNWMSSSYIPNEPVYDMEDEERGVRFGIKEPWQQFTGLKDKAGVEIYEGDVLCDGEEDNVVVVWNNEESCWYLSFTDGELFDPFNHFDIEDYEVIGNIYENPELISENSP